jgi:hypothetical protein
MTCRDCGGIHDGTDRAADAEQHARRMELAAFAAEGRSAARGMRSLMRAAQHGAPEAYRA